MISITQAIESEINVIKSMADVVFRDTYSSILTAEQVEYMMEWMYSKQSIEKQFSYLHSFFIAWRNGIPVGYMSIQKESITEDNITVYHLHKLYVMPEWQGRGVGELLFKQAHKYASENKNTAKARIERKPL